MQVDTDTRSREAKRVEQRRVEVHTGKRKQKDNLKYVLYL